MVARDGGRADARARGHRSRSMSLAERLYALATERAKPWWRRLVG
jgi:hypothetical protein